MKIGIIGDTHFSNSPPSSRTTEYREQVLGKCRFIIEGFNKLEVGLILQLGDVFHYKDPRRTPYGLLNEVADIFEDCNALTVMIPGSHDMRGSHDSPFWTLDRMLSDVVMPTGNSIMSIDEVTVYCAVDGLPPSDDVEADICIIHNIISPNPDQFRFEVLPPDGFINRFRLVFFGHMHYRYSFEELNTRFLCPGSLSRTSLNEYDRKITVAMYDTDTDRIKHIRVPSKPGREVFSVPVKRDEDDIGKDFVAALTEVERAAIDPRDLVRAHAPLELIDPCLGLIDEAEGL